jgi:KaiC/GvpD/RAD55 family RecA-like ATPase
MRRIATGIKGFDDLIQGGFPENSANLLLGSYGTGKSIFSLEYIYNGAEKFKENGLIVSFEQQKDELIEQAELCGYKKISDLIKKDKISILCIPADEVDKFTVKKIIKEIKRINAKRVVIDSISALGINAPLYALAKKIIYKEIDWTGEQIISSSITSEDLKKNFVYKFVRELRELNTTSLILSEIADGNSSTEKASEYVCDGVIKIKFETLGGEFSRSLTIKKMRKTKNDEDIHPVEISKKGVIIHSI